MGPDDALAGMKADGGKEVCGLGADAWAHSLPSPSLPGAGAAPISIAFSPFSSPPLANPYRASRAPRFIELPCPLGARILTMRRRLQEQKALPEPTSRHVR